MEPLPETRAVLHALSQSSDVDLEQELHELTLSVLELVPSCVGLSITLLRAGITVTAAASSAVACALDAVQYLDGGPCVESSVTGEPVEVPDVLDEERWRTYAATAAAGHVGSSLSLPLVDGGEVVGAANLYASEPGAFAGVQDALVRLLASPGSAVVLNGDLSFRTLDDARGAPAVLEDLGTVERAVGFVAARQRVGLAEARRRIEDAAGRAGTPTAVLARALVNQSGGAVG